MYPYASTLFSAAHCSPTIRAISAKASQKLGSLAQLTGEGSAKVQEFYDNLSNEEKELFLDVKIDKE